MKAILEFDVSDPDEKEALNMALSAAKYKNALHDIRQLIFRPARKHGYASKKIEDIMNNHPLSVELIGELEEIFVEILEDNEIIIDF